MNDKGCFKSCSLCNAKLSCCSCFDLIDPPILNKSELDQIKLHTDNNKFYNFIDHNLYSLKINHNQCFFYHNHCSIYPIRPIDCKLYPFDVIKKNEKYYLILYELDCIKFQDFEEYVQDVEDLIEKIKPWIEQFTDARNYEKLKNIKYKVVKEIVI